jgi:hypothetical protein
LIKKTDEGRLAFALSDIKVWYNTVLLQEKGENRSESSESL